jgi:LCP family protein required for cell wall assembly
VKNILLIGVDAKANQAGRSDTMILLTINERTKKIVLTSLMRDILAQYPDGKWDKLNHAHAYGGPALLLKVLKSSFNLQVDHYIKVNLDSFITVVDAMGGVDLTLKDDEVSYINRFIAKDLPLGQGKYHLTGSQVIWHVRNRSSAGSDHDRTSRQRTTIAAMMKKMGDLSLGELNSLLNVCLPLVTTNLPAAEWKNLVNEALTYAKFQVVSTALPRQGMYYSGLYKGMWAMRLDFEKNCRYLYETVYGTPAP